ncbi:MAG TPA: hypothetical protein VGH73_08740 [Thermoanaerobaculia bacterium]
MEKEKVRVSQGMTRRVVIGLVLAVLSFGSLIGASRPAPQDEGIQVRFRQLNWLGLGKTVRFPASRVATAELSFNSSATDKLVGQGSFVNLVIQVPGRAGREWVVQNLFLQYEDENFLLGSHPSVKFPLPTPNTLRVPQLSYQLSVTPEPLAVAPSGAFARARVEPMDYQVGGYLNGGSEKTDFPLRIRPWVGSSLDRQGKLAIVMDRQASTKVAPADLPAINEGVNGCAPAGVARSVQYMLGNQGTKFPLSAQDIYNELYGDMGTTAANGTASGQAIANGKGQFAGNHNLNINTTLSQNGIGSIGNAMNTLNAGGDVEVLIRWPDGSGHVAMISSIVARADGTYQITYVDDPHQGDGVAQNEEVVIIVNANGTITSGGTGSIDGLLIETLNPPAPAPGPSPTPIGTQTSTGMGGR